MLDISRLTRFIKFEIEIIIINKILFLVFIFTYVLTYKSAQKRQNVLMYFFTFLNFILRIFCAFSCHAFSLFPNNYKFFKVKH